VALTPAVLTVIFLAGFGIGAGAAWTFRDEIWAWIIRRRDRSMGG
jgi:hypothetical protein